MIIFLHELAYRSEKYRSSMENTREQLLASLERLGISPEQVEGMEDSPKDNQLYQLMGIAPLLKTAKMLTEHYNWYIGTVKGPMKLLISDNPMQGIVLGFNDIGREILAELRKKGKMPFVTKPADSTELGTAALRQRELSNRADALFTLATPTKTDSGEYVKKSPFIKKQ